MRLTRATCYLLLALTLLATTTALAAGAVVTLTPPAAAVPAGGEFTTDVTIKGAEAVLGFQFDVIYDANLVELTSFDLGPWLGNSGRSPAKLGPAFAKEGGRATVGAYTLGQQAGAGGDGLMVTLHWKTKAAGSLDLQLQKLQLAGAGGTALPGEINEGKVNVAIGNAAASSGSGSPTGPASGSTAAGNGGSSQSLLLGGAILVLAIVAYFLLRRRQA
ncbi:cohesin domain-containing protein [Candidatus Amarolinea aalborgensis]|jgi:hypothetical protein|uniref:cohesin domain-containing protein n=1 Tax=Candidatus Amarolinea aalborgensis TaxID=2249329 RepID=UPI003BFA2FCB